MQDNATYTLQELNEEIKSVLEDSFYDDIWVIAEINSITHHRSGHCYLNLIQKDKNNKTLAEARATIWANRAAYISARFEMITGTPISLGMNVMLKVEVNFHPVYGLSFNVTDINPEYTLGDLERARREIIEKLILDGDFDLNKSLAIPPVIKNIAVISSPTAAGWGDFMNEISHNRYGYKFNIELFEAEMQGVNTEKTVVNAFKEIKKANRFDIVAIIRGGGSKSDLSYFDNYEIAHTVTQFPIPVLSGIGHDRDESITDMVANLELKTPTAVATFIVDYNYKFECNINELMNDISAGVKEYISRQQLYINSISSSIIKVKDRLNKNIEKLNITLSEIKNLFKLKIKSDSIRHKQIQENLERLPKQIITMNRMKVGNIINRLILSSKNEISKCNESLSQLQHSIDLINPQNIIEKGYSISKINGKIITSKSSINEGDILETLIKNRIIRSKVVDSKEI